MALVPTNTSEQYLSNQNDTGRLAFLLDALLGTVGLSSGIKSFHLSSLGSDNQNNVSATPCVVMGFDAGNVAAYWTYVKLYNKAGATSADTPQRVFALPPGGGIAKSDLRIPFATALSIRIVKGQADNDNTAVLAGDVMIGGIDYNN